MTGWSQMFTYLNNAFISTFLSLKSCSVFQHLTALPKHGCRQAQCLLKIRPFLKTQYAFVMFGLRQEGVWPLSAYDIKVGNMTTPIVGLIVDFRPEVTSIKHCSLSNGCKWMWFYLQKCIWRELNLMEGYLERKYNFGANKIIWNHCIKLVANII